MNKLILWVCALIFSFIFNTAFALEKNLSSVDIAKLHSGEQVLLVGYIDNIGAPFNYMKDGKLQGMTPDIFKEVAKRAGIQKYKLVPLKLNMLAFINDLATKKIDVLLEVWNTPTIKKQLLLTVPFFKNSGIAFLYLKENGSFQKIDDVKGQNLGTLKNGYIYSDWLPSIKVRPLSIKAYNTVGKAMAALKNGDISIFVTDFMIAREKMVASNGQLSAVLVEPLEDSYAVRKQDKVLRDLLNQALKSMWADGSLYQIKKKYLAPLSIEPSRSLNN